MSTDTRKQWCEEQAREFFQHKSNFTKRYKVDYFYPEVDTTDWLILRDKEVEEYRKFEQKEREEFMRANPDDINNDDLWQEWLNDAYLDANFTIDDCPEYGFTSEVRRVYLDKSKNTYLFQLASLEEKSSTLNVRRWFIDLDDEEYIRLLALALCDENTTMSEVCAKEPDIFRHIASQCFLRNTTCAFFMDEIRQDAKSIIEAMGDNRPKY